MSVVAVIAAISTAVHAGSPSDVVVGIPIAIDGSPTAAARICYAGASIAPGTTATAAPILIRTGTTVSRQTTAAAVATGIVGGEIATCPTASASRGVPVQSAVLDGQRGLILTGQPANINCAAGAQATTTAAFAVTALNLKSFDIYVVQCEVGSDDAAERTRHGAGRR